MMGLPFPDRVDDPSTALIPAFRELIDAGALEIDAQSG